MKKYVYVVELKTKNKMFAQTIKTTAKLETVMKNVEIELKPEFPTASVVIYGENGMRVSMEWGAEVRQAKISTNKNYLASISFVDKKGKYQVIREGFDSLNEVKLFVKFLLRDGNTSVSYEVLKRKGE